MGAELVSVLALGETREVLAALRKNQRFALWSHSHLEHALIREIKSVRDIVRAGSTAGRVDVSKVLGPFLEVVRSPEAGGLITWTTLTAVEKIVSYGISDASGSITGAPDALRSIVDAVANCRFDATDASVDENALAMICRVVVSTLTCGPWGDTMSDETVLLGFETILRIMGGRRRSDLLKSVAKEAMCSIISAITKRVESVAAEGETTDEDERRQDRLDEALLSEPKDPLLHELQQYGLFNFSFNVESPSSEPYYTTHSLECILRLASFLVDPMACPSGHVSPDSRLLGFALLNSVLCSPPSSKPAPLMAVRSVRRILLRETSRAVLRSLGASLTEPTRNVSAAFTTALNLLHSLGPYGGPFLATILQKVFPPYVTGVLDAPDDNGSLTKFDEGTREIGLEALGALFAQPGLLAVAYASIDCNLKFADAIEPLLSSLRAMVEGEDGMWRNFDPGAHEDDFDMDEVRIGRAAALICADTLIGAIDSISDRVKTADSVPGDPTIPVSHSRGLTMESVHALRERKVLKKRLMAAMDDFNRGRGKRGARGVVHLVKTWKYPGIEHSLDQPPSEDDLKEAVQFLRTTPRLDKSVIGTVLGEPDPDSAKLLRAYTSTFKFSNRSFTAALRIFLESFRLPGEAQKIDRIVHSFSQHYYEENKGSEKNGDEAPLRNADAAYVLAFAVVMLNTDLHNHSVRKKMTLDDFIRNNRGINDGADVPREFLRQVFDSIAAVEIKMSDEAGIGFLTDIHWDETLRGARFLATTGSTAEVASEPFLLSYPDDAKVFDEEVFRICWQPALTAAVVALEESQDPVAAQAALEGFLSVARCASSFRLSDPINACISALCSSTHLLDGSLHGAILRFGTSVKAQMATVALLGVARQCGDWIRGPGWQPLTACVLRLHSLGLLPDSLESQFYGYGDDLIMPDGNPLPVSKLMPTWWPASSAHQSESSPADDAAAKRKRKATGFLNAVGGLLRVGAVKFDLDREDEQEVAVGRVRVVVSQFPPTYLRSESSEHVEARNLGRKCVEECRVQDILISETRFLRSEALQSLAKSIYNAAERALSGRDWAESENDNFAELSGKLRKLAKSPVAASLKPKALEEDTTLPAPQSELDSTDSLSKGVPSESRKVETTETDEASLSEKDDKKTRESVAAFCVDLLCELTLRNRDRMSMTWPCTSQLVARIIGSAKEPTILLERAVVALLRVASRFLHRDEIRNDVLKSLNLIVKLPTDIVAVVCAPVMSGVYQMVKAHSVHIVETSCWHSILNLIECGARSPEPSPTIGFEALSYLLSGEVEEHALTRETFAPFLDAVSAYVTTRVPMSGVALDLLYFLATRIVRLFVAPKENPVAGVDGPSLIWVDFWEPLLRVFSEAVCDDRVLIKNYALILLERVIGSSDTGSGLLSSWDWKIAFKNVIFPLLRNVFSDESLSRESATSDEYQKTKFRAVILVSKTFLQHHASMARGLGREDFIDVWKGVLECLQIALTSCEAYQQRRVGASSPTAVDEGASALLEHVPESAKNIVLVMASSGLLQARGPLWDATVDPVSKWVPDMEAIVRAAEEGAPRFEWVQKSSPQTRDEPQKSGDESANAASPSKQQQDGEASVSAVACTD